jgi:hypothetical protein
MVVKFKMAAAAILNFDNIYLCANNSFLHDVLHQYLKFC